MTLAAAVAAAMMAVSAGAYAQAGPYCFGGGPGMMGWGGGPGWGAGAGPRGGYGPGAGAGPRAGYGPGAASGGPRGFGPGAGPAANAELRLAYLKNELKITGEQQAAFDSYAAVLNKNAATMEAFRTAMFQTQEPADRFTLRAEHMKQRASDMESMSAALKDLYAVLTPEQKTIADANMGPRFGAGPGRGPGRWR
jgi:hypothetical protein